MKLIEAMIRPLNLEEVKTALQEMATVQINMNSMAENEEMRKAVQCLCNCKASFMEDVAVVEKFGSVTVWKGIVYVFKIEGHSQTDKCYAWSSAIKGSKKRRYYAVLHIPPIDSPEKAVSVSIVQDRKTGECNSLVDNSIFSCKLHPALLFASCNTEIHTPSDCSQNRLFLSNCEAR